MPKMSIRIAYKSGTKAAGQRRHDERIGKQPSYVDADRSEQNSVIIQPLTAAQLRDECVQRRGKKKRALRSNAAVAVVGVITFDAAAQASLDKLTQDEQDKLFLMSATDAAAYLGTTVTGLVVHRDESAIHAHFQMPAWTTDGKAVSREMSGKRGKERASELQDVAAAAWAELGIERGEKKAEKVARLRAEGKTAEEINAATVHRSVQQLHNDLPNEIEAKEKKKELLKAEIIELEKKAEKNRLLAEKAEQELTEKEGQEAKILKRIEVYQNRENQANAALSEKQEELAGIEEKLKNTLGEAGISDIKIPLAERVHEKKGMFGTQERLMFSVDDVLDFDKQIRSAAARSIMESQEQGKKEFIKYDSLIKGISMSDRALYKAFEKQEKEGTLSPELTEHYLILEKRVNPEKTRERLKREKGKDKSKGLER